MRHELREASQHRADELLAALLRIARHDRTAAEVLTACLWPGLRALVARYARSLNRDEAHAVAVAGLVEAIVSFPSTDDPSPTFVASRLLELPRRRLRQAARQHRLWFETTGVLPEVPSDPAGPELSAIALLDLAVSAGVLTQADANVLRTVDVDGHSLQYAARKLGIGYDATRQRRNRAARRWRAWWFAGFAATGIEETAA